MEIISSRTVAVKRFESRAGACKAMAALVGDNFKINKGVNGWLATYEKGIHTVMDGECTVVDVSEETSCLDGDIKPSPQVEQ